MKLRHEIHCLLILAPDVPGVWCAWCPQMDLMTQGDHPDNAVAMMEECIRIVVEDDINDIRPHPSIMGEAVRKRVTHPFRRGKTAEQDESWPAYQELLKKYETRGQLDWFDLNELRDGKDTNILVRGSLMIEMRSGVFRVDVYLDPMGYVPVEEFKVEYRQAFERSSTFSVRSSVLKEAGKDGQGIVLAEAKVYARDPVGEIKVSRPNDTEDRQEW